jgi:WXG100 family type VII secretion target
MVDNQLKADAGVLTHAAHMISSAHQDFETLARTLSLRLESEIAGGWAGSGAQAFVGLHEQWQRSHRVIAGALEGLQRSMLATDASLTQTDVDARTRVAGVATTLDLARLA